MEFEPGASLNKESLKSQMVKLTKKYHPDINRNVSSQQFADLRKTYESILSTLEGHENVSK